MAVLPSLMLEGNGEDRSQGGGGGGVFFEQVLSLQTLHFPSAAVSA